MKAFPYSNDENKQYSWINHGMDLRDYFAAKALPELLREDLKVDITKQKGLEWLGEFSYKIADAMIKAREQK